MSKKLKIAIVHDAFDTFGGAEKVVDSFLALFPQADIFTAYAQTGCLTKMSKVQKKTRITTSFLQFLPWLWQKTTFIQLISPLVWRFFSLKNYDLVIISSTHLLPNLVNTHQKPTFHYIHSLPKNIFGLEKPTPLQKVLPFMTGWIAGLYQHHLYFAVANSMNTQQKIQTALKVNVPVLYPPIQKIARKKTTEPKKNFITVGRVTPSKNIELMIKACNKLGLSLIIVGEGKPEYVKQLKTQAGSTITFTGFATKSTVINLLSSAKAFIFCSYDEDFGLAPVEALSYGVPVIAYHGGGPKEYLQHGRNGLFFFSRSSNDLTNTLKKASQTDFDTTYIRNSIASFSEKNFQKLVQKYLRQLKVSF